MTFFSTTSDSRPRRRRVVREAAPGVALARAERELGELRTESQFRTLLPPNGAGDPALLSLISNDYLGLSRHPGLREAVIDALERGEAMASTGSRLLSGNAPAWEELEAEFAAFAGTEAALFFTSGYAANIGLLGSLLEPDDTVFSDSANHASLIDGIRLSRARRCVFPHLDLNALEDALAHTPSTAGAKFVVVESVFSMEGDRAPLAALAALAARYGAELIVDEAHAVGVFGPGGRGLAAETGVPVLAAVFPCGKALAACGAFVAGSHTLRQLLVNRARTLVFSTALPPYLARQIRAALSLVLGADQERERLLALARDLRDQLRCAGFNTGDSDSQIVPVVCGSNERALEAAERLERGGFVIRAIRPPSVPQGAARLRISLNAGLPPGIAGRIVQSLCSGGL